MRLQTEKVFFISNSAKMYLILFLLLGWAGSGSVFKTSQDKCFRVSSGSPLGYGQVQCTSLSSTIHYDCTSSYAFALYVSEENLFKIYLQEEDHIASLSAVCGGTTKFFETLTTLDEILQYQNNQERCMVLNSVFVNHQGELRFSLNGFTDVSIPLHFPANPGDCVLLFYNVSHLIYIVIPDPGGWPYSFIQHYMYLQADSICLGRMYITVVPQYIEVINLFNDTFSNATFSNEEDCSIKQCNTAYCYDKDTGFYSEISDCPLNQTGEVFSYDVKSLVEDVYKVSVIILSPILLLSIVTFSLLCYFTYDNILSSI